MKFVSSNSVTYLSWDKLENVFKFFVPTNLHSDFEFDLAKELIKFENKNLPYLKDSKLWSEVYSPKKELEIFTVTLEESLLKNKKIHFSNISLWEEIELVKKIYFDLGYFNKELNRFEIDFINSPVTIWVNINNIIYSFKDYKSKKEKIFFIPPPREPRHQKAVKSWINAGIISTININNLVTEKEFLIEIISEEKTSLTNLANNIFYNFEKIGFNFNTEEIVLRMRK